MTDLEKFKAAFDGSCVDYAEINAWPPGSDRTVLSLSIPDSPWFWFDKDGSILYMDS